VVWSDGALLLSWGMCLGVGKPGEHLFFPPLSLSILLRRFSLSPPLPSPQASESSFQQPHHQYHSPGHRPGLSLFLHRVCFKVCHTLPHSHHHLRRFLCSVPPRAEVLWLSLSSCESPVLTVYQVVWCQGGVHRFSIVAYHHHHHHHHRYYYYPLFMPFIIAIMV
jgi:hypothetical protein